jgi:hypothetical protein
MSAGRALLFCDIALAGRIERAEAQFIAQSSEAARRRAGTAGFVIGRGWCGELRRGRVAVQQGRGTRLWRRAGSGRSR